MQRLHVDDLAGHLLDQGGWHHLSLPAIAEVETTVPLGRGRVHTRRAGDALQPGRDSRKAFDELRRQMGSATFSAQYQQEPIPPGGNMIDWGWLPRFELPFPGGMATRWSSHGTPRPRPASCRTTPSVSPSSSAATCSLST